MCERLGYIETVGDPANVVAELRRVTRCGGVVGAASVEYGGLILAGEQTAGPQRYYDIRQQLWQAAGIAEPNMGRRLRGLFQEAGFGRVEAFADYISRTRRAEPLPTRITPQWRVGDRVRWGGQLGSFGRNLDDGTHAEIRIGHRLYRVRIADLRPG